MKKIFLFVLASAIFACNTSKKQNNPEAQATPEYRLELLWETDTLLRTPESVLLDKSGEFLYVSNINLGPWEKDGNGFISKIDREGNILQLNWAEGFNAPKGMGILGSSLFVADIGELVEVNIQTGEITNRVKIEGDPQLNDITVGDDGVIYVSGSNSQKIYAYKNGIIEDYFSGSEGERFNGLLWEKERMLLITSASSQFKEINHQTKEMKIISENMGHGDCIAAVGDGGYITTSWKGGVFYVSGDGIVQKLLDTEAVEENAADGFFSVEEQVLYLPTFFKNRVKAYKLVQK